MTQRLTTNQTFHAETCCAFQRGAGRGEDFGGIAVYLMSSVSRYHHTFVIDGGYSRSDAQRFDH